MIKMLEEYKKRHSPNFVDYRPRFFHLSDEQDKNRFSELLKKDQPLFIHDFIKAQVQELLKLRNPASPLAPEAIEEAIALYQNGRQWEEIGVWVHYPWSHRIVHLLPKEEFIEVRTSRNLYKITGEEQQKLAYKKIGVVGLSVGQSVALAASMERIYGELRLADFDNLDLSNLNRIRSGLHNISIPKVVMAAREIAEIDPFLKVTIYNEGLTEDNLEAFLTAGGKLDILVDECDSLEMKIRMRQKAKNMQIPVVMDTSDRGMIDIERFDLQPERPLFHGRLEQLDLTRINDLTPQERMHILFAIIDVENVSDRIKTSLAEIGKTITTWPQLASSVIMGGGVCGDVCRRILLGQSRESGRYYIDVEKIVT